MEDTTTMANIYEKRTVKIFTEGDFSTNYGSANMYMPLLTIFEYAATEAEYVSNDNADRKVVTSMIGWDDTSTVIEINTEPLLLSSGSAVISKRLAERELTLEYSGKANSPRDLLNLEGTIKSMMFMMEPVVVTRHIKYSDSDNLRIEALLKCYITSFEMKRATQTDYSVKLVFKVIKPVKKIYSAAVGASNLNETGESL
jgi:hypothetical protein